ncbi:sensor histidine kinase [Amycolatopsis alkalitolerans]|uniref:histidine kinase n=1 Tax=Amycolatopsis alkalitolerans TaxID=2547244 RepID=A0A5C4M2B3_9PSEU|nr:ATP-binding protein [Amycolatopsis alkalitolerans]TNC26985.1 sensor histidine kinase [Amycolatopsis alkalitolerans]
MATRARELLLRSRALLDRSREAASQFLGTPHQPPRPLVLESAPHRPEPVGVNGETLAAICANVALRDLNLVDSLLSQLEEMEAKEEDTDRLAELYGLDHLATRLRRNAENLRVLAGRDASDSTPETSSLVDVIRAAMSSIDHYSRVTIGRVVSLGVVGFAAEDLSRLVAELLDNATKSSPPNAPVRVSAHLTERGSVLLRIEDEGIGLPPERLRELNVRLSGEPVLDDSAVRNMGLAVVRRLAARHELKVWLDRRVPHGTTASVLLPAAVVSELPEASWSGAQTVTFPVPGSDGAAAEAPARAVAAGAERGAAPAPPPSPRPRPPAEPAIGGTTASGLPRRISRSIKAPNGHPAPAAPGTEADRTAGHDKLLADLGAFSDGERAAKADQREPDEDEGTQQ